MTQDLLLFYRMMLIRGYKLYEAQDNDYLFTNDKDWLILHIKVEDKLVAAIYIGGDDKYA